MVIAQSIISILHCPQNNELLKGMETMEARQWQCLTCSTKRETEEPSFKNGDRSDKNMINLDRFLLRACYNGIVA